MKKLVVPLVTIAGLVVVIGPVRLAGRPAQSAAQTENQAEVSVSVHRDVSAPLRDIPSAPRARTLTERPFRPIPGAQAEAPVADGALQTAPVQTALISTRLNIAGVGNGDYGFTPNAAPPDTNGAVGATQYVQWVNESFAVFNKTTGAIAAGFPKAGNTLWAGFGGGCETNNDGDPIVQYDKRANRWVLTQFSVSTTPFLQCVAVSTTSDATGTYSRYAFDYGTQFPDYPKLGVWPDAYYITYNIFNGNTFGGPKVCAWDRAAMLAGAAATQVCFQLGTSFHSLLPSDLDGTTPPPTGAPNLLARITTSSSLQLWTFHVDFATPSNSTLTGPDTLAAANYAQACSGGVCVPQVDTRQKLDSLADRAMHRFAYRNFGTHDSWLLNHSVATSIVHRKVNGSGIRWYELQGDILSGVAPTIHQQGTFAPDSQFRWMGSIAQDKLGNIAVGYSVSGSTIHPAIRIASRSSADPLGQLSDEHSVVEGAGSQLRNLSRWGDYSAMTVDPVDDCTLWYTNEYLKANGTFNWSTRIVAFKLSGCI